MGSEIECIEERWKRLLLQLEAERGVFERMVYKNKNQHRRASYFQYLLKVRRDLRLLQSMKLEGLFDSCFVAISGKKPKQQLYLLESLKWRKCDCGTPNFLERLLGATRLLSQMVHPMLRAATEVSTLLARSFFMGFSLTILALLSRLRVLVQQLMLDTVTLFNVVSSISLKKHSIKIMKGGVEVYREYYPTTKEYVTLECVWKTDKFELFESTHQIELSNQDMEAEEASNGRKVVPRYLTIESFLGDDDSDCEMPDGESAAKETSTRINQDIYDLFAIASAESENQQQEEKTTGCEGDTDNERTSDHKPTEDVSAATTISQDSKLSPESNAKQVPIVPSKRPASTRPAFVSVKIPATSANLQEPIIKETEKANDKDSFFSLLTAGTLKETLF